MGHKHEVRVLGNLGVTVIRPIWRSFSIDDVEQAATHVRRGGFSALSTDAGEIKLLLPRTKSGEMTELAQWVLLALDLRNWGSARSGPAEGLAAVWVKSEDRDIVEAWCARDERHPPHTRRLQLDCLACGACCRGSRVVIEPSDRAAWTRAGRSELGGRAYLRTSRGETVLRHAPSGACVHFGAENACGIYPLRPFNCRVFAVGSEPCLTVRDGILGIAD
jgi:uncharacterized protein